MHDPDAEPEVARALGRRPYDRAQFPVSLGDVAAAITILAALVAIVSFLTSDRFARSDFDAWLLGPYAEQVRDHEARIRELERTAPRDPRPH